MSLAGLRTLDGYGWSDGYLRSLPGSLLWPVLSGSAFLQWGAMGPRLLALLLVATAFLLLGAIARALFRPEAGYFTVLALAVSAPFWILGHIASMEALALAAGSGAIWAILRLVRTDHRGWLLGATGLLIVAMLAQYRAVLLLIPASMLLVALRRRRAGIDIGLLWLLSALALVIYYDVFATQIADAFSLRMLLGPTHGDGSFGAVGSIRAMVLIWGVGPALIAALVWARHQPVRPVVGALMAGPVIWIGAWLVDARAGDALVPLDLALGTALLYPIIGFALSELSRNRRALVALGVLALTIPLLSLQQTWAFDRGWPDSSKPVDLLVTAMEPGDRLLSMERWPYALALYEAGLIAQPGDVLDETLLLQSDTVFDFCNFRWFVEQTPIDTWSPLVTTAIGSCGTFEPVATSISNVVHVAYPDDSTRQPVTTTVRRNNQPFLVES